MKTEFELNGNVWKDCTSYSRNQERSPTSWETVIGEIRIFISCGHIYYRPGWCFSCYDLGFEALPIKANSKEEAAQAAFNACLQKVESFYSWFNPSTKALKSKRLKK